MPQQFLEGAPAPKAPKREKGTGKRLPTRPEIPLAVADAAVEVLLPALGLTNGVIDIEVGGSVRRRRSIVHDIDFVIQARDESDEVDLSIASTLRKWATHPEYPGFTLNGLKIKEIVGVIDGHVIPVELYITTNPEHYPTLLLIRTGSKAHNLKLTTRARVKGWTLHADGRGVVNAKNHRVAWSSEEEILKVLGCDHTDPADREV